MQLLLLLLPLYLLQLPQLLLPLLLFLPLLLLLMGGLPFVRGGWQRRVLSHTSVPRRLS